MSEETEPGGGREPGRPGDPGRLGGPDGVVEVDITPGAGPHEVGGPAEPYWTTRRRFLVGGLGAGLLAGSAVAGSAQGVLPGRLTTRRWLGVGKVDRAVPDFRTAEPVFGRFASAARGCEVGWALWAQDGLSEEERWGLPVVVVLHGRGADARTAFDVLGWHRFAAAGFASGTPRFALAAADGGDTYWHPRASGDDPVRMLTDELLPRVIEAGIRGPVGLWGWSMGGFGALTLFREANRGEGLPGPQAPIEVTAAAASSPAIFPSYRDAARGAFDAPSDFTRWGDLLTEPGRVPSAELWDVAAPTVRVACGVDDPFADATRRYLEAGRAVSRGPEDVSPATVDGEVTTGRHDNGFWRWSAPAQVAFLGRALEGVPSARY